ncbi:metalloregulator ArsR/SmtB family transcription factor [Candidatus Gracilibacteria bacterium]|nr:metalloregulator ArsR/SmtB family transcription factor [Candidatus Gracilibacteria bacterium]
MKKCDKKTDLNKLSKILENLSQPMRLQIICLLNKVDRLSVCEMIEKFKIKQNLISHHLSMLRKIGIVKTQREGVKIFYSIEKKVYQDFKENIKNVFNI